MSDITLKSDATLINPTAPYTTPEKVATLLRLTDDDGIRSQFTTTTEPSREEVLMYIDWAMDRIDKYTNSGWRTRTVSDEYYTVAYPFHGVYPRWTSVPLRNQNIQNITKLIVYWSANEEDYVQTRTEGRMADWYVDKQHGILWLKRYYPWLMDNNVLTISYTYGKAGVPKDIEEAATKMVAITIMQNDFNKVLLSDGMNYEPNRSTVINRWNEDIEYILRRHMQYITVGVL
jgi:hypothetical protein